jgi:phosphoglycolate phosphatase/putative hydrolase of the HAD superfamily
MKVFRLPVQCSAVLFDMDCTLYSNPEYGRLQIDLLIDRLARLQGKPFDEMNNEITLFRNNWAQEHHGQQISIGNTFTHFGISIHENVKWREELCQPEQYLSGDEQLRSALKQLESRYALAVVTNNPVSIAIRTLSVLGVEDLFHEIIGLDTCGVSKPSEEMFMRAATLCGAVPASCVSVGDRYDIDIALPLELGMGGILVDGVEDVYDLPEVIFP